MATEDKKALLVSQLGDNLSKTFTVMLANEIVKDNEWLALLTEIMFEDVSPCNWRAAWVIDHVHQQAPELLDEWLPQFIAALPTVKSDGVKRIILRMATQLPVEQLEDGELIDLCFKWLKASTTPIASRAHCMQILHVVTKKYPELGNELALILEDIAITGSTGEKNKARKILKELKG
jgi:hypothetical protein